MAKQTITIVRLGACEFTCSPQQAAKVMAALAPLREVELAAGAGWGTYVLTGNGCAGAVTVSSGTLVDPPKPKKAEQLRLTHQPLAIDPPKPKKAEQLRLTHQPLAIGCDGTGR